MKNTARGFHPLVLNAHRNRDPRPQGQASRSSCSLEKHPGASQLQGSSGGNQGNPDPGGRGRILVVLKQTWLRDHIRVCTVLPHLAKGKGLPCRKQIAGAPVLGTCSPPQTTGGPLLPSFSGAGPRPHGYVMLPGQGPVPQGWKMHGVSHPNHDRRGCSKPSSVRMKGTDMSQPQDRETPAAPGTQRTVGSVKGSGGWKDAPPVPGCVPIQGWGARRDPVGG